MAAQTLFDKIWDRHVIADLGDDYALLHVSRHLMHDGGGRGLQAIKDAGYRVRNPDLIFATFDHVISTDCRARCWSAATAIPARMAAWARSLSASAPPR